MSAFVFDIEADGYLDNLTKIHCVVVCDTVEGVIAAYHDAPLYPCHGSLEEGLNLLATSDCIIGHNIAGFDVPAIQKVEPELPILDPFLIDTQKLCEILFPEVKKQSIENWISILKLPDNKIPIKDFSVLSQALLDRCVGDVKNNYALYKYLVRHKREQEEDGTSFKRAIITEQEVSSIHAAQVQHGVWYDVDLAIETAEKFKKRMDEIQEKVARLAPPIMETPSLSNEKLKTLRVEARRPEFIQHLKGSSPFKAWPFTKGVAINPFSKTGKHTSLTHKYFESRTPTVHGPYCKVTFDLSQIYSSDALKYFGEEYILKVKGSYNKVNFNPLNCSSDTQVKDYLLSVGWIPVEWNYSKTTREKTSPKLTEESYNSLPPGLGQEVAEYGVLQHRLSLITNLKDPENKGALSKVRPDHRVPADAFTCGTPTARYRHTGAVTNIPRPSSKYGKEIRRLYGVAPGHLMIGTDLSGIEARMLCHFCYHYTGGKEFAELVLNGDWHSANASLWGCTRDEAKTHLYALLYNAGATKLGAILGKGAHVGRKNKDKFMKVYKCYHELVNELEKQYEINGGFLYGLDGRKFYVRNKKDLLNTLLQGNSAIIFKNWMIECNKASKRFSRDNNSELYQIISYHDEVQHELYSDNRELANAWGTITVSLAKEVGRSFKLNVPLSAEYSVGRNWSETH